MITAQPSAYGRMASALLSDRPRWQRDGRDWPNRGASSFVHADRLTWHVQRLGAGPVLLLVHGTGAATHSWRDLMPILARHFTVIAVDLPGHGFTDMPPSRFLSLPAMARSLGELLTAMAVTPVIAVGHSAGLAILIRMCLDGRIAPEGVIGLNGALVPLRGVPGRVFSPVAKFLVSVPMVPQLFAWRASGENVVERLLKGTGSTLDQAGLDFYRRLMNSPGHVAAALGMMAHWDLDPVWRDLRRFHLPLVLMTGSNDRAIPPRDAIRIRDRVSTATMVPLLGLGHLAHEERPAQVAELIDQFARAWRVIEA